jgi:hypothetical protein
VQARAVRGIGVRADQNNPPISVRKPQHKDLRHELPDLARSKIHNGHNLLPDQSFERVIIGDLRGGLFDTDLIAEVDPKLNRGFARLWKSLSALNGAFANVDF